MRNSVCPSEARGEMTKAPIALQELRRRIYWKAKSEKAHRFWGIFVHVTRKETLEEAYRIAKRNGGAAGIDGQTFEAIETVGLDGFLAAIRDDLETGRYKPHPNRRVDIPKEQGKFRTLQIPCIRDRVVQGSYQAVPSFTGCPFSAKPYPQSTASAVAADAVAAAFDELAALTAAEG
jgi:hypothetical protein